VPKELIDPSKYMRGDVRVHRVDPMARIKQPRPMSVYGFPLSVQSGELPPYWTPITEFRHNNFLYEWGAIFARLLMRQGLNYGIGGMYMEFANVASPGDPVSPPTFTRGADEGVEYYNSLGDTADLDYLRVPLIASTLDTSDIVNFPKGNQPTFFAQTSGVEGVHGKGFSDAFNSTVFGGALVAFVDESDFTKDIVLSRFYLEVANQQPKLSTSQIGFEWKLTLG
jgi:hypothetical protein